MRGHADYRGWQECFGEMVRHLLNHSRQDGRERHKPTMGLRSRAALQEDQLYAGALLVF